jgi:beta-galactosidase
VKVRNFITVPIAAWRGSAWRGHLARVIVATLVILVIDGRTAVIAQSPGIANVKPETVELRRAADGYSLFVNDAPFYVKGVLWDYTPVGQKYDYNRFAMSDDRVKRLVDEDAAIMTGMGVNTVRLIGDVPPKWITYLYQRYGIHTILNHFAGRYGVVVNGKSIAKVDYSDAATRSAILAQTSEFITRYKGVPGVLAYAFSNEPNYALDWKSSEIENLPVGDRQTAKAKYLYSLLEEVMAQTKKIDPSRPVMIVNGDTHYFDLIAKLCPSMDILGTNVYRGKTFTDLWARAASELKKPVILTEFGCDAFNAKTNLEDESSQAEWLSAQLHDMQNNARGGSAQTGVCLGGCVFEFADEWWKFGQEYDLDIHNTNATWSCPAYTFDSVGDQNNMNEEWWGLCSISPKQVDGLCPRHPRKACDAIKAIWLTSNDSHAAAK